MLLTYVYVLRILVSLGSNSIHFYSKYIKMVEENPTITTHEKVKISCLAYKLFEQLILLSHI